MESSRNVSHCQRPHQTLGNLTPLGLLASEPAKVMLARAKISTASSVASVTIEIACYTASVVLVLRLLPGGKGTGLVDAFLLEIGRASCRERVFRAV